MIRQLKIIAIVGVVIAYPFFSAWAIHEGLNRPILLLIVALSAWRTFRTDKPAIRMAYGGSALLLALGAMAAETVTIRLIPSIVYLTLAALFGYTLQYPPSLLERMVRLQFPEFKPGIAEYLRQLTLLWVGFFGVNAVFCVILALFADERLWMIYTGFWVYLLMACLVIGEYIYRPRRFPELDIPPLWDSLKVMLRNGNKIFRDLRG